MKRSIESIHDCRRALGNRETVKLEHETILRETALDETYAIRYWYTDVVTYHKNMITLDTGGHYSVTTKKRINDYTPSFVRVYQEDYDWFVTVFGETYCYENGFTVDVSNHRVFRFVKGNQLEEIHPYNPYENKTFSLWSVSVGLCGSYMPNDVWYFTTKTAAIEAAKNEKRLVESDGETTVHGDIARDLRYTFRPDTFGDDCDCIRVSPFQASYDTVETMIETGQLDPYDLGDGFGDWYTERH